MLIVWRFGVICDKLCSNLIDTGKMKCTEAWLKSTVIHRAYREQKENKRDVQRKSARERGKRLAIIEAGAEQCVATCIPTNHECSLAPNPSRGCERRQCRRYCPGAAEKVAAL